jgi:primary-amine oxidase
MPSGFFNLNPSNDVAETMNHASVLADGEVVCDC